MDNSKLSEIVRKKENEIFNLTKSLKSMEEKFDKDLSTMRSADNKSRSTLKTIQSDEIKQFYESELQLLNSQAMSVEKALEMSSPVEDKVSMLQRELRSIKETTLKKIQMIENKLKNFSTTQENFLSSSPRNTWREETNENIDSKPTNRLFNYIYDEYNKPKTSHGMRKQPLVSNQNNSRA